MSRRVFPAWGLPFLTRLDARDRALFARWSLRGDATVRSRTIWRSVTALGGAAPTIGLSLGPLALGGGVWFQGASRALVVLALSHLVVQLVKRSVGRPRPSRATACATLIGEPDKFSFPSGHAAAAMSLALGYGSAVPDLAQLLVSLAIVVGFSRVALAVHYPGDVLAGQAIALVAFALTLVR